MTMKRMKHPAHGFHHPLSGGELATMLVNGWTEDDTQPKAAEAIDQLADEDKPARGRKPKAAEAGE